MKHVKSTTRKPAVKLAAVFDPYQEKKDYALAPFCPDGFTKE